jgi:hypothetical protein
MELEFSLTRLNETVAGPLPEPDQSIPHPVTPSTTPRFSTVAATDVTKGGKQWELMTLQYFSYLRIVFVLLLVLKTANKKLG